MIKFKGGPLDGERFIGAVNSDEPFLVVECASGDLRLLACYELQDNELVFVSSKTREQIAKELAAK